MTRRRHDVTLDRKPRVPSAASVEEVERRARLEGQLARVAMVLLIPVAISSVASLLHDLDFTLVARALMADEASVSPDRIIALDARADVVVVMPLLVSLPFTIAFLLWLHRAFHHAHWAGAGRWMRFSPAEAVGSFFIPIRNLVRPLQALHELARASEPAELDEPPRTPDSTAGYREPALSPVEEARSFRAPPLGAWWVTWIGAHVVGFLGTRVAHSPDLAVAANGGVVLMVSDLLTLAAAIFVGLVVFALDRRRQEVFRRLVALVTPSTSAFVPDAVDPQPGSATDA